MKKIFILAYARANVGDDLFIYILLRKYKNVHFFINIKEPQNQKAFKQFPNITIISEKERNLTKENATEFDGYIYIGGSIFMEGGVVYNISEQFLDFLKACNKNNIPFFYVSSNFGPYYTQEYFDLARKTYKEIKDICFRDKYSYNMFKDIKTVRYAPDFAFSYDSTSVVKEKDTVGISMIDLSIRSDIKEKKNEYFKLIKNSIEDYIKQNKQVYLFSFCQYEGDEKTIKELLEILPNINNIHKVLYNGHIEEFLNIYSKMEYMLCTRFHAMVLSCVFNQKKYILSYSKKIENVIEDLKLAKNYGRFTEIERYNNILLEEYERMEKTELEKIVKESSKQIKAFDKFISEG